MGEEWPGNIEFSNGWVIADYKTDLGAKEHQMELVALYTQQVIQYARYFN